MKMYSIGTTVRRTATNRFLRKYNLAWRQTIRRRRSDAAAVYFGWLYVRSSHINSRSCQLRMDYIIEVK